MQGNKFNIQDGRLVASIKSATLTGNGAAAPSWIYEYQLYNRPYRLNRDSSHNYRFPLH